MLTEVTHEASKSIAADRLRWKAILDSLEPLKKLGWKDHGSGNIQLGHDPKDYPLYYHATLYEPLDPETIRNVENESNQMPYLSTKNLYLMSNGLRLFQDISIFGVIGNSYSQAGQPISLIYGNIYEVPSRLPKNSMVIGGVHAAKDSVDYLVSHENGGISQSYGAKEYKEVSNWPDIFVCIEDFITKNMKSLNLI